MARHHFKMFWTIDNANATGRKVLGAFQKLKKKSLHSCFVVVVVVVVGLPWWLSGKESAAMQEIKVRSLGREVPWRRRWQYSCLGNPMNKGAWWDIAHEVSKELDMIQ